ncbi:MAG: winged helix-turn-helix transcriptional regulator [Ignavibacterium sp.]|jgi:DNA-binding transcriptional ArsR family regulator
MPRTKKHLFSKADVELSEIAKALTHPARIAILKELSRRQECICGEIVDRIPLAQATVSQHLKELKSLGLIAGEIEGPKSCYCINWKKLDEVSALLRDFFDQLRTNHQRCC